MKHLVTTGMFGGKRNSGKVKDEVMANRFNSETVRVTDSNKILNLLSQSTIEDNLIVLAFLRGERVDFRIKAMSLGVFENFGK